MVSKKSPSSIDKNIGIRIWMRRRALGMSQETLGERLGLTFQQVQKYEKGINRIGAGRLHAIAKILGVPVAFFFEGQQDAQSVPSASYQNSANIEDLLFQKDALQLLQVFGSIRDPNVRRAFVSLARAIAGRAMQHEPNEVSSPSMT